MYVDSDESSHSSFAKFWYLISYLLTDAMLACTVKHLFSHVHCQFSCVVSMFNRHWCQVYGSELWELGLILNHYKWYKWHLQYKPSSCLSLWFMLFGNGGGKNLSTQPVGQFRFYSIWVCLRFKCVFLLHYFCSYWILFRVALGSRVSDFLYGVENISVWHLYNWSQVVIEHPGAGVMVRWKIMHKDREW